MATRLRRAAARPQGGCVEPGADSRSLRARRRRGGPGRPARPGPRARCRRCGWREVEIISMLMPVGGEGLEGRGGHAGVRLHAGADEADPGDAVVAGDAGGADLGRQRRGDLLARRRGPRAGTVKEMSVTPWSDVFCTIMSTLTSASARSRNSRAAMPGWSGTPVDGDLGLRRVVHDGRDDGLLHGRILLLHPGAGLPGER